MENVWVEVDGGDAACFQWLDGCSKGGKVLLASGCGESPSGPEKAEECVRGVIDWRHLQVELLNR